MRHYTTNSPEAMGRAVAIALMADGAIDSGELITLERQDIINRIGLEADRFSKVLSDYCEDILISAHRLPNGQLELDSHTIGLLLDAGVTILVVGSTLLAIRQDFVGFLGFLELLLGRRIVRVTVGVMFHGHLAVGLLDLVFAGVAIDAKHFVKIAF